MMSKIISVFSSVVELAVCMAVSFNALHNISQSQLTSDVFLYLRLSCCPRSGFYEIPAEYTT